MSVGRPGGRPLQPCARWGPTVDRPVDRAALLILWLLVIVNFLDFLSLLTILHLGEDFSNLSRTET